MSAITSSWQFQALVDHLTHAFDLQRRGIKGKQIGDAIANLIVYGILGQHARGLEPDGTRLAPLSRKYLAWKILHGLNPAILHKREQMMQFDQLKGMVVISKDAMSMFYGLDPFAIQKAEWTQEGQRTTMGGLAGLSRGNKRNPKWGWFRPPREFYDINKTSWEWIGDYLDQELDDRIMSFGATRLP